MLGVIGVLDSGLKTISKKAWTRNTQAIISSCCESEQANSSVACSKE